MFFKQPSQFALDFIRQQRQQKPSQSTKSSSNNASSLVFRQSTQPNFTISPKDWDSLVRSDFWLIHKFSQDPGLQKDPNFSRTLDRLTNAGITKAQRWIEVDEDGYYKYIGSLYKDNGQRYNEMIDFLVDVFFPIYTEDMLRCVLSTSPCDNINKGDSNASSDNNSDNDKHNGTSNTNTTNNNTTTTKNTNNDPITTPPSSQNPLNSELTPQTNNDTTLVETVPEMGLNSSKTSPLTTPLAQFYTKLYRYYYHMSRHILLEFARALCDMYGERGFGFAWNCFMFEILNRLIDSDPDHQHRFGCLSSLPPVETLHVSLQIYYKTFVGRQRITVGGFVDARGYQQINAWMTDQYRLFKVMVIAIHSVKMEQIENGAYYHDQSPATQNNSNTGKNNNKNPNTNKKGTKGNNTPNVTTTNASTTTTNNDINSKNFRSKFLHLPLQLPLIEEKIKKSNAPDLKKWSSNSPTNFIRSFPPNSPYYHENGHCTIASYLFTMSLGCPIKGLDSFLIYLHHCVTLPFKPPLPSILPKSQTSSKNNTMGTTGQFNLGRPTTICEALLTFNHNPAHPPTLTTPYNLEPESPFSIFASDSSLSSCGGIDNFRRVVGDVIGSLPCGAQYQDNYTLVPTIFLSSFDPFSRTQKHIIPVYDSYHDLLVDYPKEKSPDQDQMEKRTLSTPLLDFHQFTSTFSNMPLSVRTSGYTVKQEPLAPSNQWINPIPVGLQKIVSTIKGPIQYPATINNNTVQNQLHPSPSPPATPATTTPSHSPTIDPSLLFSLSPFLFYSRLDYTLSHCAASKGNNNNNKNNNGNKNNNNNNNGPNGNQVPFGVAMNAHTHYGPGLFLQLLRDCWIRTPTYSVTYLLSSLLQAPGIDLFPKPTDCPCPNPHCGFYIKNLHTMLTKLDLIHPSELMFWSHIYDTLKEISFPRDPDEVPDEESIQHFLGIMGNSISLSILRKNTWNLAQNHPFTATIFSCYFSLLMNDRPYMCILSYLFSTALGIDIRVGLQVLKLLYSSHREDFVKIIASDGDYIGDEPDTFADECKYANWAPGEEKCKLLSYEDRLTHERIIDHFGLEKIASFVVMVSNTMQTRHKNSSWYTNLGTYTKIPNTSTITSPPISTRTKNAQNDAVNGKYFGWRKVMMPTSLAAHRRDFLKMIPRTFSLEKYISISYDPSILCAIPRHFPSHYAYQKPIGKVGAGDGAGEGFYIDTRDYVSKLLEVSSQNELLSVVKKPSTWAEAKGTTEHPGAVEKSPRFHVDLCFQLAVNQEAIEQRDGVGEGVAEYAESGCRRATGSASTVPGPSPMSQILSGTLPFSQFVAHASQILSETASSFKTEEIASKISTATTSTTTSKIPPPTTTTTSKTSTTSSSSTAPTTTTSKITSSTTPTTPTTIMTTPTSKTPPTKPQSQSQPSVDTNTKDQASSKLTDTISGGSEAPSKSSCNSNTPSTDNEKLSGNYNIPITENEAPSEPSVDNRTGDELPSNLKLAFLDDKPVEDCDEDYDHDEDYDGEDQGLRVTREVLVKRLLATMTKAQKTTRPFPSKLLPTIERSIKAAELSEQGDDFIFHWFREEPVVVIKDGERKHAFLQGEKGFVTSDHCQGDKDGVMKASSGKTEGFLDKSSFGEAIAGLWERFALLKEIDKNKKDLETPSIANKQGNGSQSQSSASLPKPKPELTSTQQDHQQQPQPEQEPLIKNEEPEQQPQSAAEKQSCSSELSQQPQSPQPLQPPPPTQLSLPPQRTQSYQPPQPPKLPFRVSRRPTQPSRPVVSVLSSSRQLAAQQRAANIGANQTNQINPIHQYNNNSIHSTTPGGPIMSTRGRPLVPPKAPPMLFEDYDIAKSAREKAEKYNSDQSKCQGNQPM